jgi:hypothetical protein
MNEMNWKAAGWAGVLAGVGLAVEGALWTASGWTPDTFADPVGALRFLHDSGDTLRWAVLAGFVNLAFAALFLAGLADRLRARTPTRSAATLWFGMIGIGAHLLVPLAYWYGVPAFRDAAPDAALGSWTGFGALVASAGGAGSLFLGLSMAAAGWAALSRKALAAAPVALGWVGLIGGAAALLTVFAPDTPLSGLASAAYLPSLLLAIVFRIWAGIALICSAAPVERVPIA